MESLWLIIPLGLLAGGLTTLAGIGGGLLVTLVLAVVWDPHLALAVAAPALLLGNGHRVLMYRREVDRTIAWRLGAPAFGGAVVGGFVAAWLPDTPLRVMLLLVAVAAVLRERNVLRFRIDRTSLTTGGAVMGFVTATTGGGGLVLAPLAMAAGLRGPAFVATNSTIGVTVHVARIGTYAAAGMLTVAALPHAAAMAVAIAGGNLLARPLRPHLGERWCLGLTWASLAAGFVLAAAGLFAPTA